MPGIHKRHQDLFKEFNQKLPELESVNGDFLKYSWSNASVVFANSTCFSKDLMEQILLKAELLRKGAIVITFTKKLPGTSRSPNWEVHEGFRRYMSWGIATVYIHKKVNYGFCLRQFRDKKEKEKKIMI